MTINMSYKSNWLTSLMPLADRRTADWLINGFGGCFVGVYPGSIQKNSAWHLGVSSALSIVFNT